MWGDIAISFLLAFIISFMATPWSIKIAHKIGAVDIPKDDRRMHQNSMPKLGGIAVIANNLFSVLGIPISCFLDRSHAYNVLFIENGEEYDSYILDYSDCVFIYDEKLRCTGRFPFFKKIENGNKEFIERVVNDGEKIELEDYNMLKINDTFYETKTGKNRIYGVGDEIKEEKKLILSR